MDPGERSRSPTLRLRATAWLKIACTLGVGTAGGAAFSALHLPLAWLLGAMIASGIAALLGAPIREPGGLRPLMTGVIGTALGGSIGPNLFDDAALWIVPLGGLVIFLTTAGGMTYLYFRKVAGLDVPTAFFAAMPGGLVEMVTLGADRGGDESMIALVHAARIFLVVLFLPFAIEFAPPIDLPQATIHPKPTSVLLGVEGVWFLGALAIGMALGTVLRLPAGHLLGPLLVSAVVHLSGFSSFALPEILVVAGQVVIGTVVGCRFIGVAPGRVAKVLTISVGSTALLLSLTFIFAASVSFLGGGTTLPLVLAYSPGGIAEMSLIALSLGIDTAFVIVHHIARVFLVIVGALVVFSGIARSRRG